MKKEIVVLAMSVKRSQYCIAGREIIRKNSELHIGNWCRPVSNHDEGAISPREAQIVGGGLPNFLDIIEITVYENAEDPTQPENWRISSGNWIKTGKIRKSSVYSACVEEPTNLWLGNCHSTDRIATREYIQKNYSSSICIIRPEKFIMYIYTEFNEYKGYNQKKRRGKIWYKGLLYNLSITDPEMDSKYFFPFPGIDEGVKEIELNADGCLICVSLTPEFQGYHYKVISKVIEND
jgi:hypothetical protein